MTFKNPLGYFSKLEDPRIERTKLYSLEAIIFQTIAAVLSGCNCWTEIEVFGESKSEWLQKYVSLPHWTPSHDTLSDLFKRIDSKLFEDCFRNWTLAVSNITEGELVVFDGKRIRGSYDSYKHKEAIHMVSAWATKNQMVIGQEKTANKSNEITAIPLLLEALELKGAIISIDAMGCQKDIADKIIAQQADYILALKNNQESLFQEVENELNRHQLPSARAIEKDHGRITDWSVSVQSNLTFIDQDFHWKNLKSIIKVETFTHHQINNKKTKQCRFYISSLEAEPSIFLILIRQHWQIENNLHWMLDVQFKEDHSRIRNGNGDQNFSLIRKTALNILKNNKKPRDSINKMRFRAAFDDKYRESLIKN